ncbi:hypothetical protein [Sphingomonas sp. NIBR02145]|uniref:hypothetical protein n=1 Tax=Sphingomonas sp. NIBR02145 TaxID=3014784 RepID=UPI0022B4F4FD|nr:hypothetical protein [Sphingomonas sp. NIBR02145]WHU04130.1 hypothetical protein O3305_05945 [Sphingomonas sp. NIBR02145]
MRIPRIPRKRLAGIGLLLLAMSACGAPQGTSQGNRSAEASARPRSAASASKGNCHVPAGPEARRQCGTEKVPLEHLGGFELPALTLLGYGEEAQPIREAVSAYNQVVVRLRSAAPEDFAGTLARAATEVRRHLTTVCAIEAHRFRGDDDSVTTRIFELYAWIGFRRSLIQGAPQDLLEWNEITALPCFTRTRDFLFADPPGFLAAGESAAYDFPSYFARPLAAHFHAEGRTLLADALWYRAQLSEMDDRKFACVAGPLARQQPSLRSAMPELWGRCTANVTRGQSCLKTLGSCGALGTAPPWQGRR